MNGKMISGIFIPYNYTLVVGYYVFLLTISVSIICPVYDWYDMDCSSLIITVLLLVNNHQGSVVQN